LLKSKIKTKLADSKQRKPPIRMLFIRYILPVFAASLFSIQLFSQGESFRQSFNEGNLLMEESFYEQALKIWLELSESNPENDNVKYKVGYCYLQTDNRKQKALPYLEAASKNITKSYNPFSHSVKEAPVEVLFFLGRAQHISSKLDEAIKSFESFLEMSSKKHFLRDDAKRQIAACKFAKEQLANPQEYAISNLGDVINTQYPDYSPVISGDENAIYFTSRRYDSTKTSNPINPEDGKYFENIYVSYKNRQGEWQPPVEVDFNQLYGNDATINVTLDGQRLYIYRDGGGGDIFESFDEGDQWSSPVRLPEEINSEHWETHATLSEDGNTLYFVSDRPDGVGGRDIYRCKKLPTGDWSKPFNLGPPINTPYDEDAPFLHPDGKTMYFSSNGHLGMGGFDIFFSEMDEDGNWSVPENLGYPINTVDDDVFFVTSPDGKRAYFSSEREGGFGEKDIYMADLTGLEVERLAVLKGFINIAKGQPTPDNLVIYVTDLNSGEVKETRPRKRDGGFIVLVDPCASYSIDYQIDDNSFFTENLDVPCESSYQEINKELYLNPISIEESGLLIREGKGARKYKLEVNQDEGFDVTGALIKYIDDDGKLIYAELVDDRGFFKYHDLPMDKSSFRFEIIMDDVSMCDRIDIILYNENNEVIGRSVRQPNCKFMFINEDVKEDSKEKVDDKVVSSKEQVKEERSKKEVPSPAPTAFKHSFQKYFDYNEREIKKSSPEFKQFIDDMVTLIKQNGKVIISIESSASKVPTRTYKSNDILSKKRLNDAKEIMFSALKERGYDQDKVEIVSESALVLGPNYKNDFKKNKETYEKYQYVKISAK
jgi:tetratricopeptide (TPR) repeat protein